MTSYAIPDPPPAIETIERLVVHPGEMLVLTVPPDTSDEAARQLVDRLTQVLPDGVSCLVKTTDISMQVVAGVSQ